MDRGKIERALALEAAAVKKWGEMSPREREAYLAAHPKTRMDLKRLQADDRSGHFAWGDDDVEHHDDGGEDRGERFAWKDGDVEHHD